MKILVLGAGGAAGVNVATCLIEAGHSILAVDTDPVALQCARGQERALITADRPVAELNELIDRFGVDFVHAQPDPEVQWLSENRDAVNARTMLPDRSALFICADKLRTALLAGDDAPRSLPLADESELEELIDELGGDCWMRLRHGAGSAGALPVDNPDIARAWVQHHYRFGVGVNEWMIAERLPGRDLSWTGVYRDGELLGFGMKERLRLLGAGRSPARVSSTANLQVTIWRLDVQYAVERAVAALPAQAHGIFMFDLREDRFGKPKITEANCGRFGTTSGHWKAARGNLPAIYAEASRGEAMSPRGNACELGVAWFRDTDVGPRLVKL